MGANETSRRIVDQEFGSDIRDITDEEVEFYDESGWVKLPAFMSQELVDRTLRALQAAVQYVEGVGFTNAYTDLDSRGQTRTAWYSADPRENSPFLSRLAQSSRLAEVHARLLHSDRVRLWSDSTNTKPPGGPATPWHQDMQAFPFDRVAGGGIWVALVEVTPEMAPLQHLTGSQREPWTEPPKGAKAERIFPSGCALTTEEVLAKYPKSPRHHLQAGDALAHHPLTFHGTEGGNDTENVRWAWISQRFPDDVRYIDKSNTRSDNLGLEVGRPLDHPSFPLVLA